MKKIVLTAENAKHLRLQMAFSQSQVSQKTGVNRSYLWHFEKARATLENL